MALPTTRDITLNPADPVPSALLNKLQDQVVGKKMPSNTRVFGPLGGSVLPQVPANLTSNIATSPGQNYVVSSGVVSMVIYLPGELGDRITGLTVRAYGDGVADCTYTAGYLDGSGVITQLANATDTNRAAAWGDFQLTPWTNRVLGVGEMIAIFVAINATNYRIQKWMMQYDRL